MSWINNNLQKARDNSVKRNILLQFLFILVSISLTVVSVKLYKKSISLNTALIYYSVILLSGFVLYLKPLLLKPFLFVWLLIGLFLGELTSTIVLGIVYYFLFTPVTMVMRFTKKNKQSSGVWKNRRNSQIDYERLF